MTKSRYGLSLSDFLATEGGYLTVTGKKKESELPAYLKGPLRGGAFQRFEKSKDGVLKLRSGVEEQLVGVHAIFRR